MTTTTEEQEAYSTDEEVSSPVEMDRAFLDSENHTFEGKQLEPYSPMRMIAAQAMGLHHGRVDDAGMEQWDRVKMYPGAQRDVCVVLWLCSIKSEHEIDEAARAPIHAAKLAIEWGADHGLMDALSPKFDEAFGLFFKIMAEVRKSFGAPESQKKIRTTENPPP